MTKHKEKAKELFLCGYNCAQATLLAFSDDTKHKDETALAVSSSFGGGMGRMREVCGAVSGVLMAAGIIFDGANADKAAHYELVRELMERFKRENGTYICRELLELPEGTSGGDPEPRTAEYYKKRPCAELVGSAARILDEYIAEKGAPL